MECIDDDLAPVSTPSTIRPRVENKRKQCVSSRLALGETKRSYALHRGSVLIDVEHAERKGDASGYFIC